MSLLLNASGSHADQYVSGSTGDIFTGNHVFLVTYADSKTCQIVLILRRITDARGLTTDRCCIGLQTAFYKCLYY